MPGPGKLKPENKDYICRAYQGGASCPELARELGVSYPSVHRVLRLANIARRSYSESVTIARERALIANGGEKPSREALVALYQTERMSAKAISERLQIPLPTIARLLRKWKIPRRSQKESILLGVQTGRVKPPPGSSPERMAVLRALWKAKHPNGAPHWRQAMERSHRLCTARKGRRAVPCVWCATQCLRTRAQRLRPCACSIAHAGQWGNWRRWHPDEPRPLILELLRQGTDPQEIGAGEIELRELELEKTLEALNVRAA